MPPNKTLATLLCCGALIVWLFFSWLACEAMGTMHPGAYPGCVAAYKTRQHWLKTTYEKIKDKASWQKQY